MNYKVTFYDNLTELLTERKANFVNKIRKISSATLKTLANKIHTEGTTAQKIQSCLGKEMEFNFSLRINDFNLKFYFKFIKSNNRELFLKGKTIINHHHPKSPTIKIEIYSNGNSNTNKIISIFYETISHELSHVFEFNFDGDEPYSFSGNDLKSILTYFVNEKELRAHCMELQTISKNKSLHEAWDDIINRYLPNIPKHLSVFLLYYHASYVKSNKILKNRYYDNLLAKMTNSNLIEPFQIMKELMKNFIKEL